MSLEFRAPGFVQPKTYEALGQLPQTLDAIIQRYQQAKLMAEERGRLAENTTYERNRQAEADRLAAEQRGYERTRQSDQDAKSAAEFAASHGGLPVEAFAPEVLRQAAQPSPEPMWSPRTSPMGIPDKPSPMGPMGTIPYANKSLDLPQGQFTTESEHPLAGPVRSYLENKRRQDEATIGFKTAQASAMADLPKHRERMDQLQQMGLLLRGQQKPRVMLRDIGGKLMKLVTDNSGDIISSEELGPSTAMTTKIQDAESDYQKGMSLLDQIEGLSDKVITAGSMIDIPGQLATMTWDDLAADPDTRSFFNNIKAFGTLLARAYGERGVITDPDVQRVLQSLPTSRDTVASAAKKLETARKFFNSARDNQIKAFSSTAASKMPGARKPADNDPLGIR